MTDEKIPQQAQPQGQPQEPPHPTDLMLTLRSIYDELDTSWNFLMDQPPLKGTVTCQRGCAHCCNRLITITIPEGMLLARHVLGQPDWKNQMQLLGRAAHKTVDEKVTSKSHFERDLPCVFLDPKTKDCQVYPIRPFNCRYLFVKSPPENCALGGKSDQIVQLSTNGAVQCLLAFLKETGLRPITAPIPMMTLFCAGMIGEFAGQPDLVWESDRWATILGTNPLAWHMSHVQKAVLEHLNKIPAERINTNGPSDVASGSVGNSETDDALGKTIPVDSAGGTDARGATDSHSGPELHAEVAVPPEDT